jgi:hypothetical protein
VIVVGRAVLGGLATSLLLGMVPSLAETPGAANSPLESRTSGLAAQPIAEVVDGSRLLAASFVVVDSFAGHRVGVVAQGWGMQYRDPSVDLWQGMGTLGIRAWPYRSLWVQGGLGAASGGMSNDGPMPLDPTAIQLTPAAMVGFGFELGYDEDISIDLSAHAGSALGTDLRHVCHASLGLTISWR